MLPNIKQNSIRWGVLVLCFSLSKTSLKLLCNVISSLLIKQVKRIVTNTINRLSEMEYQIKAKQLFSDSCPAVKLHLAWWLKKIQNHLKFIFSVCPRESDRCQHTHTHFLPDPVPVIYRPAVCVETHTNSKMQN